MKLSLAMICKGEEKNLKELHPLIKDYVDEWVVVVPPKDKAIKFLKSVGAKVIVKDHTQAIEPHIAVEMAHWGVAVEPKYRIFNFAAARNTSFSAATGDWILWLDADDRPVGLEQLRTMLESNTKADVFEVVYDYAKDNEGNSVSDHIRERVVRNNGKFTWKGAKLGLIHETIVPKDNYAPIVYKIDKDDFYVQHVSDHADQSSERNHVALLYEYIKTKGEDARTTYYLGIEFFNRKMYTESIAIMQEYVKVGGWDEERFRAWIRMAEAYHQLGDKESSRNAYLSAQKELPHYPESYLGLGESYYSDGNWGKAIEYMITGLQKKVPDTKAAIDMVRYTFRPSVFIALAYLELGKPEDAYLWFARATKLNPKHPMVEKYKDLFLDAKDLNDYVQSFVKLGQLSKRLYPKSLGKLAEAIPDELQDQEVLLDFKRRFTTPKVWPSKSIAYFCSQAFEEWGPDSLKTGCGGSEEAVIHLTKRWAKMGYDVTVFNNCPQEKTVDGVKWVRWEKFNPRDIFDVLIAWRNNPFLEPKVATKKLIDVHDVPSLKYFPKDALRDVKLLVKSQYHRTLFPDLDDDNFVIINNGIDMGQFSEIPEKTKNNLVWTSSLDRGLEYLLQMWPDIKKEVPDVTLDVAYGFNLFDVSARGKTAEGRAWKAKMLKLLSQEGVTDHGRLNSDDVAQLYLKADVWAYPTDFPEIDCITATKAMAAKCIPITTNYAVMVERNKAGIMIEGNGADPAVQDKFKEELIALLKDESKKQAIRDKLDVSNYSWDDVAQRWADLFE